MARKAYIGRIEASKARRGLKIAVHDHVVVGRQTASFRALGLI
jgi:DNA repair protein RadC